MKKEKIVKKIVIKSLLGFPIGITLLMICYASIYFIAGENVFKIEIMQLQNIYTLIFQLLTIGLIYILYFIMITVLASLKERQITSDKYAAEHPFKLLLFIISEFIIIGLTFVLFSSNVFTKNVQAMNIILFMIIFLLCSIYFFIKSLIESHIIKQINQKLKERNIKNAN